MSICYFWMYVRKYVTTFTTDVSYPAGGESRTHTNMQLNVGKLRLRGGGKAGRDSAPKSTVPPLQKEPSLPQAKHFPAARATPALQRAKREDDDTEEEQEGRRRRPDTARSVSDRLRVCGHICSSMRTHI
jgi:hypothetical protein